MIDNGGRNLVLFRGFCRTGGSGILECGGMSLALVSSSEDMLDDRKNRT